ncbi:MAG: hypothetical protein AAF372_05380 [Pseudomonadota bacterium]
MTADELKSQMQEWKLNASQLAKVLCLHTNKVSEYLGEVERIPCAIEFSIDALKRLPDKERTSLIEQRLARQTHARQKI